MTKRQNVTKTLLVAVVLLTLISACFLGSTLARYTTTGGGTAEVEVAKWSIKESTLGTATDTTINFGKLSPAYETANSGSNSISALVLTVTNESDVDALLTVSADAAATLVGIEEIATDKQDDATACFSIKLYTDASCTTELPTEGVTLAAKTESATASQSIWAKITWTTSSDALDTEIGENVSAVTWKISWTAVQSSQLPSGK